MIKLLAFNNRQFSTKECIITPTIFPDQSSQVWKLPEEMLGHKEYKIIWNFQEEREIFDILSVNKLLAENATVELHIPYLPFARQDKKISNTATFNLEVFAGILNIGNFKEVTAVDVHNPERTKELITNFRNITVEHSHENLVGKFKPDYIIFPDKGASHRYNHRYIYVPTLSCEKVRDQQTGVITSVELPKHFTNQDKMRFLLLDDLCDGGGTFIAVAKLLKKLNPENHVGLFVTHGVFSKGKKLEGIDEIFTTNSLIQNSAAHYQV